MTGIPVKTVQVFISTNMGKCYLSKKKKRSSEQNHGRNWKSNKFRAWGNVLETHGHRKDVTRKTDMGKQVQWTFPHLRISGLTRVSGGTHWKHQGWPWTNSETASHPTPMHLGLLGPFLVVLWAPMCSMLFSTFSPAAIMASSGHAGQPFQVLSHIHRGHMAAAVSQSGE